MRRRVTLAIAGGLLLFGGCAHPPTLAEAANTIPLLSSDRARIYFYRNFRTSGPPIEPTVYIDGHAIGISEVGTVFLRDVGPGTYDISTAAKDPDESEIVTMALAAGDVVYVDVRDNWVNNDTAGSQQTIYEVAVVAPAIGRRRVQRLWYEGAGGP